MDAWFWLVVTIAIVFALTTWLMWGKAYSLQVDLDIAGNEITEAHATVDRLKAALNAAGDRALERADAYSALVDQLTAEREARPARGAHGRFAKRAA